MPFPEYQPTSRGGGGAGETKGRRCSGGQAGAALESRGYARAARRTGEFSGAEVPRMQPPAAARVLADGGIRVWGSGGMWHSKVKRAKFN